jgi:anaerobic selenocysteine-containing dehydrogenase
MLRLTGIALGQGPDCDIAALDDFVAAEVVKRSSVDVSSAAGRVGPARLVDLMLRTGPYDVTLADLEAAPHGVDFGPLQPRIPEVLATPSGLIELAPAAITCDLARLAEQLQRPAAELVLIGRRQVRSNNSWMHNIASLVGGSNACTAQMHPADARRLGLVDGQAAVVSSRVGSLTIPIEVTDGVRQGVVSIPHGWGHGQQGTRSSVAAAHAGVNSNLLADDLFFDALSGTAALNGIPIDVTPAPVAMSPIDSAAG